MHTDDIEANESFIAEVAVPLGCIFDRISPAYESIRKAGTDLNYGSSG